MCSECKKIFRNTDEANFHAVKSGHDQFEESTEEARPLSFFVYILLYHACILLYLSYFSLLSSSFPF
jgi:hypothetical protein